jgi:hypothetical protein
MGGSEHVVSDEEAENVMQRAGSNEYMMLSDGARINTSCIAEDTPIPLIAFYKDYIVNKDGRTYTRDGERITIEYPENIEYLPDPKYKAIAEENEARLRIEGSDNQLSLPQ